MLQRYLVMVLLAFYSFSGAEPVGDFAPLEVGNVWVYEYKLVPWVKGRVPADSFKITISLVSSLLSGDRQLHCFENRIEGTSISTTIKYDSQQNRDTLFDTIYLNKLNLDTLIEKNISIRRDSLIPVEFPSMTMTTDTMWLGAQTFDLSRWLTRVVPVWKTHFVLPENIIWSGGMWLFSLRDEAYELTHNIAAYNSSKYRQNIGFISGHYEYRDPGGSSTTEITLLSFSNVPFTALQTGRTALPVRPRVVPVVKLSLPYLSIENNGRVFNLQGRAVPANAIPVRNVRKTSVVHR
jgi:hypothetical protein